jgi:hypothetical protein
MTPAARGEVDELLEARLVVAGTHHARHTSAKGCLGSRAALPPSDREDHGCDTPTPTEPQRCADRKDLNSSLRRSSPASRPSPSGMACSQP